MYKDSSDKIRDDMVGEPSIVFTGKAEVDDSFLGKSKNCASLLLVLMPISFIPTQCVNQFLLACIRDGNTSARVENSQLTEKFPHLWEFGSGIFSIQADCRIENNATTSQQDKWFFHYKRLLQQL